MKKKFLSNWGIKLSAFVFATLVWIAVSNAIDPSISKTISGIPIEVTNESVLTSQNKIYSLKDKTTANIKIRGKRSVVEVLSANDFQAVAPLNEMSIVQAVPVYVKPKDSRYLDKVEILDQTNSISVVIDDIVTNSYDISVEYIGQTADGFARGDTSLFRTKVDVTAPKSIQNLINKVAIVVDVSNANSDITEKYSLKLFKADGTTINIDDNIKLSMSKVSATIAILQLKTIPIYAGVTGTPEVGYQYIKTEVKPSEIVLMTSPDNIYSLSKIVIPRTDIDINNAKGDIVKNFDITKYIPSDWKIYDADNSNVEVVAIIKPQIKKTINILVDDIKIENIPEGYTATIESKFDGTIEVEGLEEQTNKVDKSSLKPSIDLTNASKGENVVGVNLILPEGVTSITEIKVNVRLDKIK